MRTETVTRIRAARVLDPYSETISDLDWSRASELAIATLAPAQPVGSSEPDETARNSVVTGYRLFLPDDEDVTALDRIRVHGLEHDVDGDPERRPGFALVVTTKRVDG